MDAQLRVLHVDDDSLFLEVSKQILMIAGNISVDSAVSTEEAFKKLRVQSYDCIISDYEMPQKNGLEFLKELREQKNDVPFVMFTGKGREEVAIKALNLGADGYFNKQGSPETVYGELLHGIRLATQRNMAEKANRLNVLKTNRIINAISDGVYVLDSDWKFVYVNKTMAKLVHFEQDKLIGKNCWQIFPKWVGTIVERNFRDVMTNREFRRFEWKGPYSDEVWEVNVFPSEEGLIVNSRAISEQRKAEENTVRSEEKYRELFESALDGIIQTTSEGTVISANLSAAKILGYSSSEDVLGVNIVSHWVDPDKRNVLLERLSNDNGLSDYEFKLKRNDGEQVECICNVVAYRDLQGKLESMQTIFRDITERKKAEQAALAADEKFRTIFENVHDVITYVDTKGKILDVNERVEELLGYKREQIINKHFTELGLISFKQLPKLLALFFSSIRQKEPKRIIELELKHKNGKKVPVEVGTRFIKDKNGKLLAIVNIFRDMTEREVADQKLRVVGSLTRHDVRNKLTVVNSNAYLLKKKLGNQPELIKYVENIENAIKQSDALFEFSRLYEQIGVEKPSEKDVAECFSQAASLLAKPELKIVNKCHGLTVIADSMLRQLFYNLIDNSLKHGQTVTEIQLYYTTDQKTIKLCYQDNGVGISEANKRKIFEGFTTGGSGLGLKLVKKMIEAYGWSIAENGEPGKGARFEITIPDTHSINDSTDDILISANFEADEIGQLSQE